MENEKIFRVEEEDERFLVKMNPGSLLKVKFLAKNPENDELFLLFEDYVRDSYLLLKGNRRDGLRPCKSIRVKSSNDCSSLIFEQDGNFAAITDPNSIKNKKPTIQSGKVTQELEIASFVFQE